MKNILILALVILLTNCTENRDTLRNKLKVATDNQKINRQIDTVIINNQVLLKKSTLENLQFLCLTTLEEDTVIRITDFYHRLDTLDINLDGYTDLRVFIFSNTPNQCLNYIFNPREKEFKLIRNSDLDIKKLKRTEYFYSYSSVGCANLDWESYLSIIKNNELINVGLINGIGCSLNENSPSEVPEIKIYQIDTISNKKTLIEPLSYEKHILNFSDKYSFIEDYWSEYFSLFKVE